jgi:cupredoxin-like protein
MARRRKEKTPPRRLTKNRMITIGVPAAVASAGGYFGLNSMIPVNGSSPAFAFPANHYIKAAHDRSGYVYVSQSSGAVKGVRTGASGSLINPTYTFGKDELESIHFINEDYDTHSQHNFNIDEFNVHTHDLKYFESQTITFVADKAGTYHYYCTIHPEMKGDIVIER